ncbi:hypothetical protein ARMSODRAFT_686968 [Armillaria solidipes]|uniref:Secreted protein n=1 Tax=Armillaria solidipes TaxID=1076256 RepID=A0A2H3B0W4_9AGAR|nr:hypothetical protein ARMSODRAFT_686968 [Armillaria solidipes]
MDRPPSRLRSLWISWFWVIITLISHTQSVPHSSIAKFSSRSPKCLNCKDTLGSAQADIVISAISVCAKCPTPVSIEDLHAFAS